MVNLSQYLERASEEDIHSSATLRIFKYDSRFARKILNSLNPFLTGTERILDMGCGYGFTTKLIATYLGFKEVYGVDIDCDRILIAKKRGLKTYRVNLETEKLPFPDEHFDLVISLGAIEHLRYYDNSIKEAYRVLKHNGIILVSAPNLGHWINRMLLLFGYQPRDVEVSNSFAVGLPGFWPKTVPETYGHIHTPTLRAMTEVLRNYGFVTIATYGVPWVWDPLSKADVNTFVKIILRIIDVIISKKPSLALRFFIVAQKV